MAQTITTRVVVPSTETPSPHTLTEGGTYTAAPYTSNGGAVEVKNGGTVTGSNVTFAGNTATDPSEEGVGNGGAIYSDGGTVALTNATFSGNSAVNGGAVYVNAGTVTGSNVTFTGNTTTNNGGAIYNNNASVTISDDATFSDNSAVNGGAIYNAGSTLAITGNATFSNNTTTNNGGAIQNRAGSTINFSGSSVTFTGNTARYSGSAIYNAATVNFSGTIDLATASDTWVNNGSTSQNYATVNWDLTGGRDQYASIKNFERYSNNNNYVKQTITVTADQATGDYVIATGSLGSLAEKVKTYTVKTAEDAGVSLSVGGSSVKYGGNTIYYSLANVNDAQLVLTVTDTSKRTVVNNKTTTTLVTGATYTCPYTQIGGAAVYSTGGTVTGTDITFAGNTSSDGGAIFLCSNAGVLAFDGDVIFVGNTAKGSGGAIYAKKAGSTLSFAGGTFAGNASKHGNSGGAIACYDQSSAKGFTIRFSDDVIFDNNLGEKVNTTTTTTGGAIYIDRNSQLTFEKNVTFTGNTGAAGALYSNGSNGKGDGYRSTLVFGGDLIASNNYSYTQGAIYASYSDGTVSGNAIFTGNTCSGGKGSALALSNSTFSFAGGTFADNVMVASGTTACYGGAIYASQSSALTFTDDVVFTGNTMASSNSFGGAIYNGGTVTLNSATFTGNTVMNGDGGAIYNDNGGTVTLKGAVTLATASDDIYNKGTLNWDLAGGTDSYGSVVNYHYLNNDGGTLTITAAATQPIGNYVIATGDFTDYANKDTFIVKTAEDATGAAVKIKGACVSYGKLIYSLTVDDNDTPEILDDDKLILNAEDAGTVLEVTKAAGYGPVDDFLVYSREAYPLGTVDRGSVFASAFFGGTVSAGSGLLASPTIAL